MLQLMKLNKTTTTAATMHYQAMSTIAADTPPQICCVLSFNLSLSLWYVLRRFVENVHFVFSRLHNLSCFCLANMGKIDRARAQKREREKFWMEQESMFNITKNCNLVVFTITPYFPVLYIHE